MSRTILIATCAFLVVVCFSTAEGGNCQSRCADRCGIMHKRQQRSYWDCTKRCAQLATTCDVCYGPRKCLQCMTGYRLTNNQCVYDLCVINNGGCSALEDCSYSIGSVVCTCKAGYHRIGTTCTDINECATNNGGCASATAATCTNTAGSFKCACNQGYTGNGKTCTDINECLANNGGCSNDATCGNIGGGFTCTCKAGYNGDGFNCADVNECDEKTANCDANAACHNTIGSFTCTCNPGYYGDGTKCTAFPKTCVEVLAILGPQTLSGEYSIWVPRLVQNITVYCEMGLNDGNSNTGYTFINPIYLSSLTDADVQSMIKDTTNVILRMRKKDGSQPYGLIKQLQTATNNKAYPVQIHLGSNAAYATPENDATIGAPYLYVGILPSTKASIRETQGFTVNGNELTFVNCDGNPFNYFALYPNFQQRTPSNMEFTTGGSPFLTSFVNGLKPLYWGRRMPEEYFMFFEMRFGGCGGFTQTDGRTDTLNNNYLAVSVGFR